MNMCSLGKTQFNRQGSVIITFTAYEFRLAHLGWVEA